MARMITASSSMHSGYLVSDTRGFSVGAMPLASRSRRETRVAIELEGQELHDRATKTTDVVVAQACGHGRRISAGRQRVAGELRKRGHDLPCKQVERLSTARTAH